MDKWSDLEKRITQLVNTVKHVREENAQLNDALKQRDDELHTARELVGKLEAQNQHLQQGEEERLRFQQEREEIYQRLGNMLSQLEQVQL